jgi:uncharacterized membrane protein
MNPFFRRHPLVLPIAMLICASVAGLFLLGARGAFSRHLRHFYLPWNLFLAWLPLLLALGVRSLGAPATLGPRRRFFFFFFAAAWLLFLPNAPYLLTDLVHLPARQDRRYFADLMLILHFALTGLMLGVLSMHVMHTLVERRLGWLKGWCFVGVVAGLTGLGIYIGRFLRWNSWDVLCNPWDLTVDLLAWAMQLPNRPSELIFPALFASVTALAYALFASLLRPALPSPPPPPG